jgi:hypothetical protein
MSDAVPPPKESYKNTSSLFHQSDGSEGDQELENLEEAFDAMKRAAGVDTIEEVLERFQTQDVTGKVSGESLDDTEL